MIIKVFKTGTGSSKGPIDYLLGKDMNGKKREPEPAILSGSKEAVAFLIDNNHRQQKYTSGVIAFRDNERPTAKQLNELLKDFRQKFLPNLDEDKAPMLLVRHLEKGNLEIHFLVAKQTSTGKALNISPPGPASRKLFDDFQKIQNDKMGFKQVTPNLLKAQFNTFEKHTRKAKIGGYLVNKVKNNELHTYSDLLRHLEQDLNIKITRRGKDFISVKMPGKEKAVRLKGPAFTPGANLRELLKKTDTAAETLTQQQKEKIQKSLENGIKQRADYNQRIYNTPAKNRGLNFQSKTPKAPANIVPKVGSQPTAHSSLEGQGSSPQPSKSPIVEFSSSTHSNPSTSPKKLSQGSSGPSGSGSGDGSSSGLKSIDVQIASVKAQMNSERNPARKAQLLTQLLALQAKREQMLLQEHNDKIKKINKFRP